MRIHIVHLSVLAIVSVIAAQGVAAIAEPASPAPAAAVDCANASTNLVAMKMPQLAATGNIDHDYLMQADAVAAMSTNMAKIEMACGKNPMAQKAAQATIARDEAIRRAVGNALHVGI